MSGGGRHDREGGNGERQQRGEDESRGGRSAKQHAEVSAQKPADLEKFLPGAAPPPGVGGVWGKKVG